MRTRFANVTYTVHEWIADSSSQTQTVGLLQEHERMFLLSVDGFLTVLPDVWIYQALKKVPIFVRILRKIRIFFGQVQIF